MDMHLDTDIAIAFDLDDTLYEERDYVKACVAHVAEVCSPLLDVEVTQLEAYMHSGLNPYDGLRAGVPGLRLELSAFLDIYRATEPETLPMRPDAARLLDVLVSQRPDIPRFLITDGRLHGQMSKINALQLNRYFAPSNIIVSDATGFDKYSPMPFATAMVRASRSHGWVYIGDNVAKDFYWPRRLGWTTIMLSDRGYNTHPQPPLDEVDELHRPDFVIDSLDLIISNICQ